MLTLVGVACCVFPEFVNLFVCSDTACMHAYTHGQVLFMIRTTSAQPLTNANAGQALAFVRGQREKPSCAIDAYIKIVQ